jgi:hypothetical protein
MVDENGQMYIPGQPKPGRCMDVPTHMKPLTPPPPPDLTPTCSYNSDGQKVHTIDTSSWAQQYQAQQEWQKRQPRAGDFYGVVNIINGQMVHPHANDGWYGQEKASDKALQRATQVDPFQGYNTRTQPQMDPAVRRQMIDDANVAAFYGMSYYEYMDMNAHGYRMMSECVSKILGRSKEETEKRAKQYDFDPVGAPRVDKDGVPFDENAWFYPRNAFGPNGQLTPWYLANFCVNHERIARNYRDIKVTIKRGDEIIHCNKIEYSRGTKPAERIQRSLSLRTWIPRLTDYQIKMMSDMRAGAPERKIDEVEGGNVFDITLRTLLYPAEERAKEASRSMSLGNSYYQDSFIESINKLYISNKKKFAAQKAQAYAYAMSQSPSYRAGLIPTERIDFMDNPLLRNGPNLYAMPGYDIGGVPLSRSKGKIVRVNTENGEEEMYDPIDEKREAHRKEALARLYEQLEHKDPREFSDEEFERRFLQFDDSSFDREVNDAERRQKRNMRRMKEEYEQQQQDGYSGVIQDY